MRKYCTIIGMLLVVVLPVCAQNWTPQDSLRLRRLLDGEGEIKLNPEVLKEMGRTTTKSSPIIVQYFLIYLFSYHHIYPLPQSGSS